MSITLWEKFSEERDGDDLAIFGSKEKDGDDLAPSEPSKERDGDDFEKLNRGTRWRRLCRGEKLARILQKTTILKKSKFDFLMQKTRSNFAKNHNFEKIKIWFLMQKISSNKTQKNHPTVYFYVKYCIL